MRRNNRAQYGLAGMAFAAAGIAAMTGCERGAQSESSASQPASPAQTQPDIEKLLALPYAGFVEDDAPDRETGVVLYDEARSYPGYTLYAMERLSMAELIDERGKSVRTWRDEQGREWYQAELLESGDLLVVGAERNPDGSRRRDDESRYAARYSWSGELIWKQMLNTHHDIEQTPGGKLLTMTIRRRSMPEIHARVEVRDEEIVLLEADGTPVRSLSLYDAIQATPGVFSLRTVRPKVRGGLEEIDLFHSNSVEWMPHASLVGRTPAHCEDCVLVSFRNQDRVAAFDWSEGKVVWAWGESELSGQHDAQYLENGHILVFDNGVARHWSRVVELDPASGSIVWEYKSEPRSKFYTLSKGGCQRLPNGNTLIAHSDSGHAFEVTPEGEKVWEFFCPHRGDEGGRATIVRAKRYERAMVERILAGAASQPASGAP